MTKRLPSKGFKRSIRLRFVFWSPIDNSENRKNFLEKNLSSTNYEEKRFNCKSKLIPRDIYEQKYFFCSAIVNYVFDQQSRYGIL